MERRVGLRGGIDTNRGVISRGGGGNKMDENGSSKAENERGRKKDGGTKTMGIIMRMGVIIRLG